MSEAKWRELLSGITEFLESVQTQGGWVRPIGFCKDLAAEVERIEKAADERVFMALGAQRNAEGLLKEAEAALAKHHAVWALDAGEHCPVCGLVRR